MKAFGLPQETIDALEAPMDVISFDTIVERIDEVLAKAWTYQFDGPQIIDVPKQVPINNNAKNPRSFKTIQVPHYQCSCQVTLHFLDGYPMIREYTLQVPVEDGSFEVARDLSFIYAAHKGFGVGKRTIELFPKVNQTTVALSVGLEPSEVERWLEELKSIKTRLGIKNNYDLSPYVKEWSSGEYSSIEAITKANIGEFTDFLRTKLSNQEST